MKNLETLIFSIFLSFIIFSCANEEFSTESQKGDSELKIGTIVNGEFKLDNQAAFQAEWEQRLRNDGYDVQLTDFKIEYGVDGAEATILIAQSKDQTFKTAIQVEKINNEYFEVAAAGSVTCTGCRMGCNPKKVTYEGEEQWICTSCIIGDTCIKSVKIEIEGLG